MARKPHRGGTVLAVGAAVGEGIDIQRADMSVPVGAKADADFHLVAGGTGDLAFLPGIDQLGRAAGFEGDKSGIHLAHRSLLGAKAAADAGLFHPDAALGDAQRPGQDSAAVEHDLGGRNDVQTSIPVQRGIGAEGLHHGLLEGPGVVGAVQDHITVRQNGLHIAVLFLAAGHQVALVVPSHGAGRFPILLRVDENGVVQRGMGIGHCGQNLIFHLDQAHGPAGRLVVLGGDDGHRVAHKTDVPVQNQPVIGRRLGVGLARDGKTGGGHILPGIDVHHAGHLAGKGDIHAFYHGVGVRAAEQPNHQRAAGHHIAGVDRLAQKKLHGVLFAAGLADNFILPVHCGAPPVG